MFIEIAYGLLGLALVVLVIYLIILFSKIGKVVDETAVTIKTLTSDVNVTLHQTNELLAKVNVLTEDLNQKVATIDPLFTAVADLSVSVSDLNDQARQISKKAVVVGGKTVKTSVGLKAARMATSVLPKPTSPTKSRSIGCQACISFLISAILLSWSSVSTYGNASSKAFWSSSSFENAKPSS